MRLFTMDVSRLDITLSEPSLPHSRVRDERAPEGCRGLTPNDGLLVTAGFIFWLGVFSIADSISFHKVLPCEIVCIAEGQPRPLDLTSPESSVHRCCLVFIWAIILISWPPPTPLDGCEIWPWFVYKAQDTIISYREELHYLLPIFLQLKLQNIQITLHSSLARWMESWTGRLRCPWTTTLKCFYLEPVFVSSFASWTILIVDLADPCCLSCSTGPILTFHSNFLPRYSTRSLEGTFIPSLN